ncbi:hypothetical protein NDU88_006772 [Pleurodeles waltl]|uniref:Uncharacterized protein n=1 Tax=Pleurodeles waltl TaxID=8319 RepID=A0AAV7RR74_PLEWA|nr:hypothetical protein NDU88_006772 [Pleurodeles waltl]
MRRRGGFSPPAQYLIGSWVEPDRSGTQRSAPPGQSIRGRSAELGPPLRMPPSPLPPQLPRGRAPGSRAGSSLRRSRLQPVSTASNGTGVPDSTATGGSGIRCHLSPRAGSGRGGLPVAASRCLPACRGPQGLGSSRKRPEGHHRSAVSLGG